MASIGQQPPAQDRPAAEVDPIRPVRKQVFNALDWLYPGGVAVMDARMRMARWWEDDIRWAYPRQYPRDPRSPIPGGCLPDQYDEQRLIDLLAGRGDSVRGLPLMPGRGSIDTEAMQLSTYPGVQQEIWSVPDRNNGYQVLGYRRCDDGETIANNQYMRRRAQLISGRFNFSHWGHYGSDQVPIHHDILTNNQQGLAAWMRGNDIQVEHGAVLLTPTYVVSLYTPFAPTAAEPLGQGWTRVADAKIAEARRIAWADGRRRPIVAEITPRLDAGASPMLPPGCTTGQLEYLWRMDDGPVWCVLWSGRTPYGPDEQRVEAEIAAWYATKL